MFGVFSEVNGINAESKEAIQKIMQSIRFVKENQKALQNNWQGAGYS